MVNHFMEYYISIKNNEVYMKKTPEFLNEKKHVIIQFFSPIYVMSVCVCVCVCVRKIF